jgi:hypothetical protein
LNTAHFVFFCLLRFLRVHEQWTKDVGAPNPLHF